MFFELKGEGGFIAILDAQKIAAFGLEVNQNRFWVICDNREYSTIHEPKRHFSALRDLLSKLSDGQKIKGISV